MATPTTLPATFVAGNVLTAAQMNDLRGAFRIMQVVNTTKTDIFSLTSTTFTDITGFNATITPSSTSSQVLAVVTINGISGVGNPVIRLLRGSTPICLGDAAGVRQQASNGTYGFTSLNFHFLDSPATTSATNYKVQIRCQNSAGAAIAITTGATGDDANRTDNARFPISITLFEVSA
jgi:hypothetical protein